MANAPDLTGPRVEIALESNGVLTPLEQILGLGPGVNFVDRVSVKIGLGKILNMQITLDPPLDVALQILRKGIIGLGFSVQKGTNSTTANDPSAQTAQPPGGVTVTVNKVAVRLWNGGIKSPWFKGLLFQPEIDLGPEGISITMQAFGMLFESSKTYPKRSFPSGTTKMAVINELLGNQVKISYTKSAEALLNSPITEDINSNKNNFETAKEYLSAWNCGITTVGSNTAKDFQGVTVFALSEPKLKKTVSASFVAYRQIDPSKRVFPLLTYSSPIQNLILPSAPWGGMDVGYTKKSANGGGVQHTITEVGGKTYNERSQAVTSTGANNKNATVGGSLDTSESANGGAFTDRSAQAQKSMPTVPEGQDMFDRIRGYVHDYVDKVFEYDISSVAIPDLLPGGRVSVGISNIAELTGTYDLYEIEHNYSGSGCETKMHCVRTGGLASIIDKGLEVVKNKGADAASTANQKISSSSGVITQ